MGNDAVAVLFASTDPCSELIEIVDTLTVVRKRKGAEASV